MVTMAVGPIAVGGSGMNGGDLDQGEDGTMLEGHYLRREAMIIESDILLVDLVLDNITGDEALIFPPEMIWIQWTQESLVLAMEMVMVATLHRPAFSARLHSHIIALHHNSLNKDLVAVVAYKLPRTPERVWM